MLIDVKFSMRDPQMAIVLAVIAGENGPTIPKRISKGMYRCGHWSVDQFFPRGSLIEYQGSEGSTLPSEIPSYGVCDTPDQICERFPLETLPGAYFVSFVRLLKRDQDPEGGWRWHKWGEYIGTQKPQCEYLYDEPEIEEVHTFHIYEVKPQFRGQIEERSDEVGAAG
jgi:hypothetical protein